MSFSTTAVSSISKTLPIAFSDSNYCIIPTMNKLESGTSISIQTLITGKQTFNVNAKNCVDNTYYERPVKLIAIGY